MEVSILHHAGIVLIGLWILSAFNWCHTVAYFVALIYLFLVRIMVGVLATFGYSLFVYLLFFFFFVLPFIFIFFFFD